MDMDLDLEQFSRAPLQGKVVLYTTRNKDSSTAFTMTSPVVNSIAPVLKKLSGRYSPIQSIAFFFFFFFFLITNYLSRVQQSYIC
jgi:hypothetical protein